MPERAVLTQSNAVAGALRDTSVSHIGLRVPDVEATASFYGRVLGLVVHEKFENGGVRMGWGVGHHVLDLLPGDRALHHYAFEVRGTNAVDQMRDRLVAAGHRVRPLDCLYLDGHIGEAAGISATDADGNEVHFHSPVWRQGEMGGASATRPVKYQHITIGTADVHRFVQFFTDVIGFRITDQLVDGKFAWLRSNRDHHTLAVVDVGVGGNVDHYSFDLAEWEDFKTWCDRLTDQGVQVSWGPGRHGPGNNLFVFFDDPAGNHIELSAEMERFFDDRAEYQPRLWQPSPATVNLWGGQTPAWRDANVGKRI